jgi:hypothetical protein
MLAVTEPDLEARCLYTCAERPWLVVWRRRMCAARCAIFAELGGNEVHVLGNWQVS